MEPHQGLWEEIKATAEQPGKRASQEEGPSGSTVEAWLCSSALMWGKFDLELATEEGLVPLSD